MPKLIARPEVLRHNLAVMREACARTKASCLFVFKEAPLHPELTASILDGCRFDRLGVMAWPEAGLDRLGSAELHHVYSPSPMLMKDAAFCQTVYLSSRFSLERLAEYCGPKKPSLRLTLECGDGRDGIHEDEIEELAALAVRYGFPLRGLSLNFACLSQKPPTLEALHYAERVLGALRRFSPEADISAGGTDVLELADTCPLPPSVREIRCGTGVMLGLYPLSGRPIPQARQDAFRLEACILELRVKDGRRMALLDLGSFHTAPEHLIAPLPAMRFCGASSGYSVFDVTDCDARLTEGMVLRFSLDYKALARALTSQALPFVFARTEHDGCSEDNYA